ncbi:MAG: alpha/beta fold hydrolase [Candidatus Thorarchaeota archaeon]
MPFFEYNQTKIHYVDIDKREDKSVGLPLVFIHGGGSHHFAWAFQLVAFSKTNRCVAVDLSGHGKSEVAKGEVSIGQGYACEIAALVNHLNLQDFILVGHSLGGGVAMSYTLNPEFRSPKALVLVGSSPDLKLPKVLPGLIIEAVEEIRRREHPAFEEYAEKINLQQHRKTMVYVDTIAMQRDLRACNKFDLSDEIQDITIPTFAIVGEDDDIITPTTVNNYVKDMPYADIAVVRDSHHVPMVDQPEEFNRLFRKFITWVQDNV